MARWRLTPILVAITTSGLLARLMNVYDIERLALLYTAALLSGLYSSPISTTPFRALVFGVLSGIPLTLWVPVFLSSSLPLDASQICGEGVRVGDIVGLRLGAASGGRALSNTLRLVCANGHAVFQIPRDTGSLRILLVGSGPLPLIVKPLLIIKFINKKVDFNLIEKDLITASGAISEGGIGVVKIGNTDPQEIMASMSLVLGYASEHNIPVIIDSCNLSNYSVLNAALDLIGGTSILLLRICTLPTQPILSKFTGISSIRVACNTRDLEIIRWALTSILGVEATPKGVGELSDLLKRGLCIASNVCSGVPGAFIPAKDSLINI
ncbi:MAG: hypothetical protein F7C35_02755 [Desulfurococcales archaeon]|nr:hypothetical protein [Desulfurococcales archaeon]